MLLALAISVFSVALGAWLALSRVHRGWLSVMRWLAVVAAGGVALFAMLPEAWSLIGWTCLPVAAVFAAFPLVLERLRHVHLKRKRGSEEHPGSAGVGLSLGYAGLLVHKVGDGMALAAFGGVLGVVDPPVLAILALHTIPVTALVVLAFARCSGPRAGLLHAIGLGAASVVGVLLTVAIDPALLRPIEPWITSAVAGLLLHIVAHDMHPHGAEVWNPTTLDADASWLQSRIMTETLFSKILRGDIPCHRVYEDDHVLAFLDIGPLSRGHTLVIPKQEVATLAELSDESAAALGRVLPRLCRAITAVTGVSDMNVLQNNGVTAHQAVMHVHFHIIPKPSADRGLGLEWRPRALDHDSGTDLAAQLRDALA